MGMNRNMPTLMCGVGAVLPPPNQQNRIRLILPLPKLPCRFVAQVADVIGGRDEASLNERQKVCTSMWTPLRASGLGACSHVYGLMLEPQQVLHSLS